MKRKSHRRFDTFVRVERIKASATAGADGHIDQTDDDNWEEYWLGHAHRLPKGSREFYRASQINADLTELWEVQKNRATQGITSEMRAKFRDLDTDRTFNILGPPSEAGDRRNYHLSLREPE